MEMRATVLPNFTIERLPGIIPERLLIRHGDVMTVECERVYLSDESLIPRRPD